MSSKNMNVGLQIDIETTGVNSLKKGISELEQAGVEVSELKQALESLEKTTSDIERKQSLINNFKKLKTESKAVAQAIDAQQAEIRKLAAAMKEAPTKKLSKDFDKATRSAKSLKEQQQRLGAEMQKARNELMQHSISTKSLATVQRRLNNRTKLLNNSTDQLAQKMRDARSEIQKAANTHAELGDKVDVASSKLSGMSKRAAVAAAGLAAVVLVAKKIVTEFSEIDEKFDKMERTFTEITGSMNAADVEMGRMIDVANRLGLSLTEVSKGYTSFLAAAKGANYTFSESSALFEQTARKVTALGGTTEEINGILLAFSQILSKGTVATEELNQIAERLPGTFQFAANALGVTTGELRGLIATGDVAAADFLPKFIEQLQTTGEMQETNVQTTAKLRNEYELFMKEVDKSLGVTDRVQEGMGALAKVIRLARAEMEGDTNFLPDFSVVVDEIKNTFNIIFPLLSKVGVVVRETSSNFIEEQVKIADANHEAKQSTDELVQSLITLNQVRNSGNAEAIAKAELEASAAIDKMTKSYQDANTSVDTHNKKTAELTEKINELAPKYEDAASAADKLKAAGLENSHAYIEQSNKAIALKNQIDALTTAQQELAQIEVGVGTGNITERQAAIESLTSELVKQRAELADIEKMMAENNATGVEGINTQIRLESAIKNQNEAIADNVAKLAELDAAYKTIDKSAREAAAEMAAENAKLGEALKKLKLDVDEFNTGISKDTKEALAAYGVAAQAAGGDIEKLARAYNAVSSQAGKSKEAQEALNDSLLKSVAGDKEKADAVRDTAKAMTEVKRSSEKAAKATESALSALNLNMNDVARGLSTGVTDAVKNWTLGMDALKQKGQLTADAVQTAFTASMSKLKTAADFREFYKELERTGTIGLLTAERLGYVRAGMQGGAEAAKAYSDALNKNTDAKAANRDQTEQLTKAEKDGIDAKNEAAEATEKQNQAQKESVSYGQAAANVLAQATKGYYESIEALGLQTDQLNQLRDSYNRLLTSTHASSIQEALDNIKGVGDTVVEAGKQIVAMEQNVDRLSQALNSSSFSTLDMRDAIAALQSATVDVKGEYIRLDETKLNGLQQAIDAARQKMADMRQEAEDTRASLEAQLASLRGDDSVAQSLNEQKRLRELNLKLQEAEAKGQQEIAAEYRRAIELQKQVFDEERRQQQQRKADEAKRKQEADKRQSDSTSGNSNRGNSSNQSSSASPGISARDVADAWDARIAEAEKRGAENFAHELYKAAKRRAI